MLTLAVDDVKVSLKALKNFIIPDLAYQNATYEKKRTLETVAPPKEKVRFEPKEGPDNVVRIFSLTTEANGDNAAA